MMGFEAFSSSFCGAKHTNSNMPSEDFALSMSNFERNLFAVADGHGDENCIRARIGSELACRSALAKLKEVFDNIQTDRLEDKLCHSEDMIAYMKHTAAAIVEKWKKACEEHLLYSPFTEEELSGCRESAADDYRHGKNILRAYGTTLIAGLVTERFIIVLQQGDGRCVIFDRHGHASEPVSWDERCIWSATTSLCDKDAKQRMRFTVIDNADGNIAAVFFGTDGVDDSFSSAVQIYSFYRSLLAYAGGNSVDGLSEHLKTVLPKISEEGSQDDVSIAGVINMASLQMNLDEFALLDQIDSLETEIKVLDSRITSMEAGGRYLHYKEEYEQATARSKHLESKVKELKKESAILEKTGEIIEQELEKETINRKVLDWLLDLIWELFTTKQLPSVLRLYYKQKCKELDACEKEALVAREAASAAEREFQVLQDRYDGYVLQKTEAEERLASLKSIFAQDRKAADDQVPVHPEAGIMTAPSG